MKYFFLSMFATAILIGVVLKVPAARQKILARLESFAEWHEKGTTDLDMKTSR